MPDATARVVGADKFADDLRAAARDLPRRVTDADGDLGRDIVREATAIAARLGGVAAHSAADGVIAQGVNPVAILLDAGRSPTILGAEHGGGAHGPGNPTARGGHTTQFPPWLGTDGGYFVVPAVEHETTQQEIERRYGAAIDKAMHTAFPD